MRQTKESKTIILGGGVGLLGLVIAFAAAIPIIVIALPYWLVAVLTRAILYFFRRSVVQWPQLFEYHPTLGWKAKKNFDGYCLEERDDVFHVSTGSDGWPSSRTIAESKIVVFGDSHAFGYGVDAKRAFFEVADVPMKPIGAPGYNMVQEVILMEEFAWSLKEKHVMWFVYYGNDLYDNLAPEMGGYRAPFVASTQDGQWHIVTHHVSSSKWSASSGRQGRQRLRVPEKLYKKSFLGDRAFSACDFLIRKGRDICQLAGAELIIMTIPTPAMLDSSPTVYGKSIDAGYPDQMIRGICEKLNVRVICLKDHLSRSDYRPYDEHWSEAGHRKVARIIEQVYREKLEIRNQRQQETSHNQNIPASCAHRTSVPL
jgi:hypothetical protein